MGGRPWLTSPEAPGGLVAGGAAMATGPAVLGPGIYRHSSYGTRHPLRMSTVTDPVRAPGWLAPGQYRTSPRARAAALIAWHTQDDLAALQRVEAEGVVSDAVRQRHGPGTTSNPVFPEMFRRPATAAGAAMPAVGLVRDGGTVCTPPGGTHHGVPDRANGVFSLNDPVPCILSLRRRGWAGSPMSTSTRIIAMGWNLPSRAIRGC